MDNKNIKKLNIEELKKGIFTGNYGECLTDYSNGYICDAISEIADQNVDLYYYDLANWLANEPAGFDYCDQAINEFDCKDMFGILRTAQFLENENELNENINDYLLYWTYDYIKNVYEINEIDENINDEIIMINFENFEKFENIIDEIDEIIENVED